MAEEIHPALGTPSGLSFLWHYMITQGHPRSQLEIDDAALQFVAHCFAGFKQSKAQLFQDLYVTHKLPGRRGGFFVEFGAMDGVLLSNTCHLEQALGWNGILAEPLARWHPHLHANRKAAIDHRCVWWESGKTLEFLAPRDAPELSTLAEFVDGDYNAARRVNNEKTTVQTVSLDDLLTEHGAPADIDYLSVDTEGSELDILSAFDFDRHKVRIITVEHNFRPDIRGSIHQLLTAHGFVRELEVFSNFDDWYYHPARV